MLVTVVTDASWCPRSRAGGWACWIKGDGIKTTRSATFRGRAVSSEQAEIWALHNALHIASSLLGVTRIVAQSDCLGALGKMPETYSGVPIEYRHVKGHTRDPAARSWVNRWCDARARERMKEKRDGRQT